MITTLLIARHGNTFAPGDIVRRVGITDLPLVESGLQQGQRLGHYLKENNLIPDIIFTSQLKRAIQTAEQAQLIMNTSLPIETLSIFNEIYYGPDENQPEDAVVARLGKQALSEWEAHAKVPKDWNVDPQDIIQNWKVFSEDIANKHAGKKILVVTSNGIARFSPYLTGDFQAFATQHAIKISTGALCIFNKSTSSTQWKCLDWNIRPT